MKHYTILKLLMLPLSLVLLGGCAKEAVEATKSLKELNRRLALDLPEEEYETLSDLIIAHAGRVPQKGEKVCYPGLEFHIQQATPGLVTQVKIKRLVAKVAILPDYSLHLMTEKYKGLLKYLEKATGYRIEWVSAASYDGFLAAMERAKADVSFQNPLLYTILAKTKGAYPLVKALTLVSSPGGEVEPQTTSRGVIIARTDRGIKKVEDLRGRTIMVPSRRSFFGYVAPLALCQERGLKADDFTLILGKRHDQVVLAVSRGQADAGFVKEAALEEVKGRVDLSKLTILARTEPFPNWCFAAFPESNKRVVKAIQEALLNLNLNNPEHQEVLRRAGVGGFLLASDEEYNGVRQTVSNLNLPY
ncbi:MAG TPA: transporter substrate-binding domain-containing protein [Armatimonadetes bacterium]|nr:transporter substrate-binding domain-containing protein [Armatimonadota bacterium]